MKHLDLAYDDGVATVTLNRPDVRNAFNEEVIAELGAVFHELGARDEVRVVVLAARGPAFSAGADLNWMKRMAGFSRKENLEDATALARMLELIWMCPKPTIARVHGDVYAGGLGLVAACDVAVAAEQANFCLSEVRLGLVPATISPYVIRAMGARAAHRYFLTAERFDAAEALRIGFVHEVAPAEELDARIARYTQQFKLGGPASLRRCKQLLRDVADQEITPALVQRTVEGIADVRVSPEGQEGVRAFLEKRKPLWP